MHIDIWGSATWDLTSNKWIRGLPVIPEGKASLLVPFITNKRPPQYTIEEFEEIRDEIESIIDFFRLPTPYEWGKPPQKDFTPSQLRWARRYQSRSYHMRYSDRVAKKLTKKVRVFILKPEYFLANQTLIVGKKRAQLASDLNYRNYYNAEYAPTNQIYPNVNGEWPQPDGTWKRRTVHDLQTPT